MTGPAVAGSVDQVVGGEVRPHLALDDLLVGRERSAGRAAGGIDQELERIAGDEIPEHDVTAPVASAQDRRGVQHEQILEQMPGPFAEVFLAVGLAQLLLDLADAVLGIGAAHRWSSTVASA